MSEAENKDSKTEEPSEKKISDAIEKGNIPVSREASSLATFVGILLVGSFATVSGARRLTDDLSRFLDDPGGFSLENGADTLLLVHTLGLSAARFVLPAIIILLVSGLTAAFLQNAPRIVLERIRPSIGRISLRKGFGRIFGAQGGVEFLKALFKFGSISFVALLILRSEQPNLINAMFTDPSALPEVILRSTMRLLAGVCIATILLVTLDLIWARFHWRQNLRMSRQEQKDEHKQAEGDPLVKARMRSLARDRARSRMIAAVPKATLVIANPTHYAVALRYVREEQSAPVVVAKGQDLIALKIREIAQDHSIPVIEDRELARALYSATEVDRAIPPDFYHAVAEVIFYIYHRNGERVI